MNIESIKQCIEKIEKELVELKAYVDEIKVEKTPNQLRAEVIKKAKSFVEIKSSYLRDSTECDGGFAAKKYENPNYSTFVTKCIFIVNAEKRTVVAILKYLNNSIQKKSIVKCNPSDVFNEHIGKAIALGRVLGLDVSEFEHAVQPTHATGQVCKIKNWYGHDGKLTTLEEKIPKGYRHTYYGGWLSEDELTIINDTNAIYGGVK